MDISALKAKLIPVILTAQILGSRNCFYCTAQHFSGMIHVMQTLKLLNFLCDTNENNKSDKNGDYF